MYLFLSFASYRMGTSIQYFHALGLSHRECFTALSFSNLSYINSLYKVFLTENFGCSADIIRDYKTGDSLCYAFIGKRHCFCLLTFVELDLSSELSELYFCIFH